MKIEEIKSKNYYVIIIGSIIALCINLFILPFIHTIITFILHRNLEYPISHYFFWGNLSLIVVGIYVGFSKASKKVLSGAIVGFLYVPFWRMLAWTTFHNDFDSINCTGIIIAMFKNCVLCALFSWCTIKTISFFNSKKNKIDIR